MHCGVTARSRRAASIIRLNLRSVDAQCPMEESIGAAVTLVVDPEISHSQDSRSMLAILVGRRKRVGAGGGRGGRRGWYDEDRHGGGGRKGGTRGETRNGRADQALRRDGFGFEGWHNVEGGGGRIGGWLSN